MKMRVKRETLQKLKNAAQSISGTLTTLMRIPLMCRPVKKFPRSARQDVVILGNGPSLNGFLDKHRDFLKGKDSWAVNYFAATERFEEVKPEKYLIQAPEYWLPDVDEEFRNWSKNLFHALATKTQWEMTLFVPVEARKYPAWQKKLAGNKNIRIVWFNNMPVEGFKAFRFKFYDWRCGMPRPHNVIIPSLMNAILSGYKNIYLTGVDHDWIKSLHTAEDNTVYLVQEHFYYDPVSSKPNVMKKFGKMSRKMHEILEKFMLAFKGYHVKGYHEIAAYAGYKGVKIYNTTVHSFIDAFPKLNLEKLQKDKT